MSETHALHITLPEAMVQMVRQKVASGEYPSESAVIEEGLAFLADHDAELERWLHEEVAPTYDEVMRDPDATVSATEARNILLSYMDANGRNKDSQ